MHAHPFTDQQILDRINRSPQTGLTLLMERYTGLIWSIVSRHLQNPEDIKECVNETFSIFYFQRDKYDPQKSSLPVYLAAIARNLAVSRYRKEKSRGRVATSTADRQIALAELRADVERAMKELRPDEADLIRMKYYDGMSIKEIAASLGLPYETVKKRHQRSIGKLRRSFLLTLIIVALLALSACTYCVLRHYDLIPDLWEIIVGKNEEDDKPEPLIITDKGKDNEQPEDSGVTANMQPQANAQENLVQSQDNFVAVPESSPGSTSGIQSAFYWLDGYGPVSTSETIAYNMKTPVSFETEYVTGTLKSAVYAENTLKATVLVQARGDAFPDISNPEFPLFSIPSDSFIPYFQDLYLDGALLSSGTVTRGNSGDNFQWLYCTYENIEMPASPEVLTLSLSSATSLGQIFDFSCSVDVTFSMERTPVREVQDNVYKINDLYSLLTVPRRDDSGALILSIYPLCSGDGPNIMTEVICPAFFSDGYSQNPFTVTDPYGNVYTGECQEYYSMNSGIDYFEWNFGQVPPGGITLHIPFICLSDKIPEDFYIPVDLSECTFPAEKSCEIYGGRLYLEQVEEVCPSPDSQIEELRSVSSCPRIRYWEFTLRFESNIPDLYLCAFNVTGDQDILPEASCNLCPCGLLAMSTPIAGDFHTGEILSVAGIDTSYYDVSTFRLVPVSNAPIPQINYLWDKDLDIPLFVN